MPNILSLLQEIGSRYDGVQGPNPDPGPALQVRDRLTGSRRPIPPLYPSRRPAADAVYAGAFLDANTAANRKPVSRPSRDPRELARIIRILMNMRGKYRGGSPNDLGVARYGGGPGGMRGGMGRPSGR
jgi:hypothetical protein